MMETPSGHRIVSLLPSATEIVCALGLGSQLVGRSHECDFPPEVQSRPICTGPKIDASQTSAEIDRQVKSLLAEALSIYRIDTEALRKLGPDFILTQAQCEVCAVPLADVEKALQEYTGKRPRVLSLSPQRLAEVWASIREVSRELGAPVLGEHVAGRLEERVRSIHERSRTAPHQPSVAMIEWLDPLMAAGNWVPELVELAGGVNTFGVPGEHSPALSWEALLEQDPEVIVAAPCGFTIERTRAELPAIMERSEWPCLRAVREHKAFLADGSHCFNRPGPRLVESLEILAEVLHPGMFAFGHEGMGWRRAEVS